MISLLLYYLVPGVIGVLQALEAIKIIIGIPGMHFFSNYLFNIRINKLNAKLTIFIFFLTHFATASFSQQLLLFDAMTGKFRNIKLRARQKECSSCGDNPSITKELINYEEFCGAPACDQVQKWCLLLQTNLEMNYFLFLFLFIFIHFLNKKLYRPYL